MSWEWFMLFILWWTVPDVEVGPGPMAGPLDSPVFDSGP
jgi:hypothetical protein